MTGLDLYISNFNGAVCVHGPGPRGTRARSQTRTAPPKAHDTPVPVPRRSLALGGTSAIKSRVLKPTSLRPSVFCIAARFGSFNAIGRPARYNNVRFRWPSLGGAKFSAEEATIDEITPSIISKFGCASKRRREVQNWPLFLSLAKALLRTLPFTASRLWCPSLRRRRFYDELHSELDDFSADAPPCASLTVAEEDCVHFPVL